MFFTEELSFVEYLKEILEQAKEREQIKNVVLSKVGNRVQVIFEEQKIIEEYKELVEHLQNTTSILRENLLDLKIKFIWLTAFSSFAIAGLVAYLLSIGG